MKAFNILFIILFVLSAALQYNDLDPLMWMALYLYGALICLLSIRGRPPVLLIIGGLVIYAIYAIYLVVAPEGVISWFQEHDAENIVQSMKAEKPWIEMTREFFGLVLLIIALGVNFVVQRRKRATITPGIPQPS